jgi:hypothetical protein
MSATRRTVELVCGDPKTNQQTASKAACNITINNTVKPTNKPNVIINDETDYFDENQTVEVEEPKHNTPATSSISSLYVSRQIIPDAIIAPKNAEGYVQTASRLTITEAEILTSNAVKDIIIKAFNELLTSNDTALLSHLAAATNVSDRKIVLTFDALKTLIATVIRLVEPSFKEEEIKIKVVVNDIEVGCCGCSKPATFVRPLNEIASIAVGNQDLYIHQFEAYHTLEDKLNISLKYVYSITKDKELNAESQA